ncbi:hypothetical protein LSAT2_021572 [Lamellibrachia satsuma]|nr:hypothetical protein LSAT2_021572 [Lamellibrachia satsuma]
MLSRPLCLLSLVASAVLLGTVRCAAVPGLASAANFRPNDAKAEPEEDDALENEPTFRRLWRRIAQVQDWAENSVWDEVVAEKTTHVPTTTTEWIPPFDKQRSVVKRSTDDERTHTIVIFPTGGHVDVLRDCKDL